MRSKHSRITSLFLAFPSAAMLLCGVAGAEGIRPIVPEAQAQFSATQGCVEPTEEMRKNHMNYLLHQRDETMHRGIRTKRYSLEECINCHVAPSAGGAPVRADSDRHFCNSCHAYAAVHIDCFQCHNDQPEQTSGRAEAAGRAHARDTRRRVDRNMLSLFPAEDF